MKLLTNSQSNGALVNKHLQIIFNKLILFINKRFHTEPTAILTTVDICPQASERLKRTSKDDWKKW